MEHEVKTIILRFRDMVIQDTIFEHNQLSRRRDMCGGDGGPSRRKRYQ